MVKSFGKNLFILFYMIGQLCLYGFHVPVALNPFKEGCFRLKLHHCVIGFEFFFVSVVVNIGEK